MTSSDEIVCIEVKVVDWVEDLSWYVWKRKIKALIKTFESYLHKFPTNKQMRIDVVFVKSNKIYEVFENIVI